MKTYFNSISIVLSIEEQLEDSFVEFVEDIIAQESNGKGDNILTKEELKELKEEYEYENEDTETT